MDNKTRTATIFGYKVTYHSSGNLVFNVLAGAAILALMTLPVAWVSHVLWIVKKLASDAGANFGQIALGFFGILIPPVGVIHEYMIWFS